MNKSFDGVWQYLQRNLKPETEIQNWAVFNEYLGDNMTVTNIHQNYIYVHAPKAQTLQHIPKGDFKLVWELWSDYIEQRVKRYQIRDLTRFSKYIISIFHWYELETTHLIANENEHRMAMWHELLSEGRPQSLSPTLLRAIGMFGGAQGIYVDKTRTAPISPDGVGITVGLLHTISQYPDELAEDGILYHYPKNGRPQISTINEIEATKNAGRLSLPVFVISRITPSSSIRDVFLGWVEGWDDEAKQFLITFGEEKPSELLIGVKEEPVFELFDTSKRSITEVHTRSGQQRFRFQVLKRYGQQCAFCDIDIPQIIETAHLVPKQKKGSDDPRNGLVLCANHHKGLEKGLLGIHPVTKILHYKNDNINKSKLHVQRDNITHLINLPHEDALAWLWKEFSDN